MVFSSLLRRRSTLLKSLCYNSFAGTRRMATTVTSTNKTAPAAPWLRIWPCYDYDFWDGSSFKFYCLEDDKIHSFFRCAGKYSFTDFTGSSQGWMVLYCKETHAVDLVDPTTDRIVRLPCIGGVLHRLIVDDKARVAVAAAGSGGRLALCRPHRSGEWTPFPSERACDSLTYSSRHGRLFCITRDEKSNGSDLEIWDVEGEAPKLEWKMDLDPKPKVYPPNIKRLKYVACAEHSGEVYVVERHFRIRHGLSVSGCFVDGAVCSEYRGADAYGYTPSHPYQTTRFMVYKVDRGGRRLTRMKRSLDGVAIFIGLNEPMAIPASEVAGVKPDSIYFTYDRRIRYKSWDGIWYKDRVHYMDKEVGRVDYSNGNFKPVFISNINDGHLQNLMWFSPPKR